MDHEAFGMITIRTVIHHSIATCFMRHVQHRRQIYRRRLPHIILNRGKLNVTHKSL
jgi:hypothetical protein